jgi:endonuclease III
MATTKVNWPEALLPLIKKYKGRKFPLEYHDVYQLVVMVVLAAQSTDAQVNKVAPGFFAGYPDMAALAKATPEMLFSSLAGIRNFAHKASWLVGIAQKIKTNKSIPLTLEELVELPGIGRKSANVILREAGKAAEGVIVDLHVVRVAPRLGIVKEEDPKKIEEKLMKILPKEEWDAGMAMSFLGREICRPKPECAICLMNKVCAYYLRSQKAKKPSAAVKKPKGAIK